MATQPIAPGSCPHLERYRPLAPALTNVSLLGLEVRWPVPANV